MEISIDYSNFLLNAGWPHLGLSFSEMMMMMDSVHICNKFSYRLTRMLHVLNVGYCTHSLSGSH